MLKEKSISEEISRIKTFYEERDNSLDYTLQYQAFKPLESGYRCQQLHSLSKMLYAAGVVELSGLYILDVGCGAGRVLGDFIGMGGDPRRMCGIDISEHRLLKAVSKYPSINFLMGDGIVLPFEDSKFDLVVQSVVFSSIGHDQVRKILGKEMVRVLKPGGFIWWWDILCTVAEAGNQKLEPKQIFHDLPIQSKRVAWLPRPSEGISKRRWRLAIGWLTDLFAAKPTHLAALLGPKGKG